jgi:epoxyqueuosine reductase
MTEPIEFLYRSYGARAAWLKGAVMCDIARKGRDAGAYGAALIAAFPYYCGAEPGNISLYARGLDYHVMLAAALEKAAALLGEGVETRVCVDSSPIDERKAACLAGLGVIGKNGLLITKEYGSYVFLGEILVRGAPEAFENQPATPRIRNCSGCGACARACPTGFLRGSGVCLSAITQKKGELTPEEEAFVRANGYVWGCDVCQLVCPANAGAEHTKIPEFCGRSGAEMVKNLDCRELSELGRQGIEDKYKNRAFMWRGSGVLIRNAALVADNPGSPAKADGAEGEVPENNQRKKQ